MPTPLRSDAPCAGGQPPAQQTKIRPDPIRSEDDDFPVQHRPGRHISRATSTSSGNAVDMSTPCRENTRARDVPRTTQAR